MGGETNIKSSSPLMYDVQGTDQSKINPAGFEDPRIAKAYEDVALTKEELIKKLEERYAQPNWYKIAAGFAKPQLGGFMASLGSAAEAEAERTEQQRAIQPTIANMRSQLAQQNLVLTQKKVADDILQKEGVTPETAKKIIRLAPDSPQAQAFLKNVEVASTQAGTKSTELGTSLNAQRAKLESPAIEVKDYTPQEFDKSLGQSADKLKQQLVSTGKYTPEALNTLSYNQLLDANKSIQDEYAGLKIKDARTAGDVVDTNVNNLTKMTEARYLASSPEMDKLLGLESGQSAISALFGYIAHPDDPSQMSRLSSAARKLESTNPESYNNFVVLQKVMQQNLADARQSITNPSNNAQGLLATTYPNLTQPRDAIIKILDLMAHEKSSFARQGLLRQNYKGDPTQFESPNNASYANLKNQIEKERLDILQGNTSNSRVPNFYHPYNVLENVPKSEPKEKTTERPKLPKGFHEEMINGKRVIRADKVD